VIASDKKNVFIDKTLAWIFRVGVFITLVTTIVTVFILGRETLDFFRLVPIMDFISGTDWGPLIEPKTFGIWPLICGTALISFGAIAIAVPFGLMIAIQLSEFSSPRLRSWLKPTLEILAGIPTVVYGYFALTFITPALREIFPNIEIFNGLSASIVVGIMILPMVASLCDDAFRAIPRSLRDGAYSLGATSREVVQDIILPAASGRVVAAVLLALSRAVGETMAVTLAAGSTPKMTASFFESVQTMTAYIVQVSLGDVEAGGVEYLSSFAVGFVLLIMTLIMNGFGTYLILRAPRGVD
jgi:phosphate transport system permease protein